MTTYSVLRQCISQTLNGKKDFPLHDFFHWQPFRTQYFKVYYLLYSGVSQHICHIWSHFFTFSSKTVSLERQNAFRDSFLFSLLHQHFYLLNQNTWYFPVTLYSLESSPGILAKNKIFLCLKILCHFSDCTLSLYNISKHRVH